MRTSTHYFVKWNPLGFLFLSAFLVCAKPKVEEPALVWPSPPEKPRIAYVQSIHGPDDVGVKKSAFRRLGQWFTGTDKTSEMLQKPFGLALDEKSNLCLTDMGANAVCYFDRSRKKWQRWDQVGHVRFASPVAIAKKKETFFVADSALGGVVAFNERGKLIFVATNQLERPSGLVTLKDRLFVADSQRHCVVVLGLNGIWQTEFGKRGTGSGEFNFPTHLSVDGSGNLLVTDSMNSRIQVFDENGRFKMSIGRMGNSGGHFSRPKGVACDSFGHLYVVDGLFGNVQIFNSKGEFLLNFGESGANVGEFWLPNGIVISGQNELFVADSYNHRIQVFKYVGGEP